MAPWKGAGYGMGLAQAAVMLGVFLGFPPASVQFYVYYPCVVNGTLTHGCGETRAHRLFLVTPCLVASAATMMFVTSTAALSEAGAIHTDMVYSVEALEQTGLWGAMFWAAVAAAHLVVVLAACSPCDVFAAVLAVYLMVSFLQSLCRPLSPEPGEASSGSAIRANANILGYTAGLAVAAYCVPEQYANRFPLLIVLGVLDYFLGVGHVWDRAPSMETVASCRTFWCCCACLSLAGLYGAWRDDLLLPVGRDAD